MNKDASPEQILRFLQKHATTDNTEAPDLQIQLRPVKQTDVRNIRSLYAASQLESTHSALNALLFSAPVATVLALLFAAELYCIYQEFYLIFAPLCLFQLVHLDVFASNSFYFFFLTHVSSPGCSIYSSQGIGLVNRESSLVRVATRVWAQRLILGWYA
jgi:hypothetical protein